MSQQEGEPWARSEAVFVELVDFGDRNDPISFALHDRHPSYGVAIVIEFADREEVAWDGVAFLPPYSESSRVGQYTWTIRRSTGWPTGRLGVRVDVLDSFEEYGEGGGS